MTRRLAALATALAGIVTLASSLSANEPGRQALLDPLEPGSAQPAAHALGAIVVTLRALLAPAHARDGHDAADHRRAARIVAAHGGDSIAPFALRADKAYFFSQGGMVSYRTLRETAVVAGDPVGPRRQAGAI